MSTSEMMINYLGPENAEKINRMFDDMSSQIREHSQHVDRKCAKIGKDILFLQAEQKKRKEEQLLIVDELHGKELKRLDYKLTNPIGAFISELFALIARFCGANDYPEVK